jgi:hypothetical protein
VPGKWRKTDFEDIEELHSLVETGSYTFPHAYDFSCTIDADASKVPSLSSGNDDVFTLAFEQAEYDFLGEKYVMSQFSKRLTGWKEVRMVAVAQEDGNARQSLTLIGARLTHTWPRFVKTVAPISSPKTSANG